MMWAKASFRLMVRICTPYFVLQLAVLARYLMPGLSGPFSLEREMRP